jgi:hypothetical protein
MSSDLNALNAQENITEMRQMKFHWKDILYESAAKYQFELPNSLNLRFNLALIWPGD